MAGDFFFLISKNFSFGSRTKVNTTILHKTRFAYAIIFLSFDKRKQTTTGYILFFDFTFQTPNKYDINIYELN